MAETTTAKYGWTKPDPGASANTWGTTLNATTDKIDAQVFTNAQAGVPIGAVTMFAGATAPTNWLICDGSSLSTTTYAALFAILGYAFGGSGANFSLPNLVTKFPIGAGGANALGASGGAFAVTLATANLPAHTHPIADPTHTHTINQGSHTHGASQAAHAHAIATGSHSHGIVTGSHAHTYQQWSTGGGVAVGVTGTSYFQQNVAANTSTVGNLGGNTDTAGNLGGNTDTQTPGVTIAAAGTGVTNTDYGGTRITATDSAGGGATFNVVPPFQAINYIIRFA